MQTRHAIEKLRHHLGYTQKQLAKALGTTNTSISRYENGYEPTPEVLRLLSELSHVAKAPYLGRVFWDKWRISVLLRVNALPSVGAARRLPLTLLESWANAQRRVFKATFLFHREGLTEEQTAELESIARDAKRAFEEMAMFLQTDENAES